MKFRPNRKRNLSTDAGVADGRLMFNAAAAMLGFTGLVGGMLAVSRTDTTDLRGEPNSVWLAGGQRGQALLGSAGGSRPSFGVQIGAPADFDVAAAGDRVLVHERTTGEVIELDGRDGRKVSDLTVPNPTDERPIVVAAGRSMFVVDVAKQSAMKIAPDGVRGEMVELDGGFDDWVGGTDGRLWLLDRADGETAAFDGEIVSRASLSDREADLTLSMLGDDPVVLDRTAGKLRWPRRSESVEIGAGKAVLQQPGHADACVTLLVDDRVQCISNGGVEREMPFVIESPETAQLFASSTTVVAVWPGLDRVVAGSWRTGLVETGVRKDPSKRPLVATDIIGQLLVDDPGSGYAITANGARLTEFEKFSAETIIVTTDGQTSGGVQNVDSGGFEANLGQQGAASGGLQNNDDVNDPPVARDDAIRVRAGSNVDIDVRRNDTDPDNDPLTVTDVGSVDGPGDAQIVAGRSIVYSAPTDASGTVTFRYTVADPLGETSSAVVTVTVVPSGQNTDPVLADDEFTTPSDVPVDITPFDNDSDAEGDTLSIIALTDPSHGTVERSDDPGKLVYTPDPGFIGSDSFRYTASDGYKGTGQATIKVIVAANDGSNRPPVAQPDVTSIEAGSDRTLAVTQNDDDPDGDSMFVQPLDESPAGLTLTLLLDNTIRIRAAAGASGVRVFSYTLADAAGLLDTTTVTVTIEPPTENRPPIALDDIATATVGQPALINVKSNDYDPDDDATTVVDIVQPAKGGSVTPLPGNPDSLRFVPDGTVAPGDSVIFRYTIEDTGKKRATAQVRIDILAPSGGAPVANDDSVSVLVGDTIIVPVIANDVHPDGLPISIIGQPSSQYPAASFIVGDKTIQFVPPTTEPGVFTFRYTISDSNGRTDSATVTVVVAQRPTENQPPTPNNDNVQTEKGVAVVVDPLSNDSDPDGDPISIAAVGDASHGRAQLSGGKIRYSPDPDYVGLDSFTYTVTDDKHPAVEATVVVKIAPPANSPPAANDDLLALIVGEAGQSIDPVADDIDLDGGVLRLVSYTADPELVVVQTGNTLKVSSGTVGRFRIAYVIADPDGGTATAAITVVVSAPPNKPPIAKPDSGGQILEFETATISVLDNDFDPNGGSIELADFTQPTSVDGDPGTVDRVGNQLVFTPRKTFSGVVRFTYRVVDPEGAFSDPASVTVTVNPCPPPPNLPSLREETRFERAVSSYPFGRNGTRPAGIFTFTSPPNQPGSVELADDARGKLRYTPPKGFNGPVTYTYQLETPCGQVVAATVTVTVNSPPTATDDNAATDRGKSVLVQVLDNDSGGEVDDVALTVQSVSNVVGGQARIVGSAVEFTPERNAGASGSFSYTMADEGGLTASASVRVAIGNTPPQANDDLTSVKIDPGQSASYDVLGNDADADNDTLTITDVSVSAADGLASFTNGRVDFTAAAGSGGDVRVNYTISDGRDSSSATWVLRVNRAPTPGSPSGSGRVGVGELAIDVLAESSDPDGDVFPSLVGTPTVSSGPPGTSIAGVTGGRVVVNTGGQSGTVVLSFTITDGSLTASGTATLTVRGNTAPTAGDDFATITIDPLNPGPTSTSLNVLGNDNDPDSDPLSVSITGASGSLSVSNNGGGNVSITSDGTPGSFSVTYQIDDGFGGTASATIQVTVN